MSFPDEPSYEPFQSFMPPKVYFEDEEYDWGCPCLNVSGECGYWTKCNDGTLRQLPSRLVLGPEPVLGSRFGGGPIKKDCSGKEFRIGPDGHQAADGTYYKGRYGLVWKYGVIWRPSGMGHFSRVGPKGNIVLLDDAEALDVSHLCNPLESPYGHEGDCISTSANPVTGPRQCVLCWKHSCSKCGFRTNRHCIVKCLC